MVLDNAGHTSMSRPAEATVPVPLVTIDSPAEGSGVRDQVVISSAVDPEHPTHVVTIERQVEGAAGWTPIGTDDTSPVYTAFDSLASLDLAAGTPVHYRAVLHDPDGTTATSAVRTAAGGGQRPCAVATLHYFRPAATTTSDAAVLGPAHVGRRGRPGGAGADRLGPPVAGDPRRRAAGRSTTSRWWTTPSR